MMKNFKKYLKEQLGFSLSTVNSYNKQVAGFIAWMNLHGLYGRAINYNHVIDYVALLQQRGNSYSTISGRLKAIGHYINFKGYKRNPIDNIRLQGRGYKVLKGLMDEHEIDALYGYFKALSFVNKSVHMRNVVILGLLCYQGLQTNELVVISVDDIDFDKGSVYINQTPGANARVLKLHPKQMLDMYVYLNEHRGLLLDRLKVVDSKQLLFGNKRMDDLGSIIQFLPKRIKGATWRNGDMSVCRFVNFRQIRSSVIVNWLKHYDVRKVQYMAGHRNVSSTERYKEADISKLKQIIQSHHPLGGE